MSALSLATTVPAHPRPSRSLSFAEAREGVAGRSALSFPDITLDLTTLHVTEECLIEVPGIGTLTLTSWSRQQLSRMLGIKWERWFSTRLATPRERKEEIERRLHRLPGQWKIRARRYGPEEHGAGDGILRAFLGPDYTPIDDERVFDRLSRVMGDRTSSFRFIRVDLTDTASYYVAVTTTEVDLGHQDLHRNGFLLKNSEVGAGAVALYEYLYRLVCTNGLVIGTSGNKLFRRVHRITSDESIDRDLAYAFTLLPERWEVSVACLRLLRKETVAVPEAEIRYLMEDDPEVRPYTDKVIDAYRADPEPTRFGLMQAFTRTAQALSPDARFILERFAGSLVPQEVH